MGERINIISCVNWVKRGVTKPVPEILKYSNDDVKRVIEETKKKLNITGEVDMEIVHENDGEERQQGDDEIDRRYNMDDYDESDDDNGDAGQPSDLADLTVYGSNQEDPYFDREEGVDEDEDEQNHEIKPSDNLLLIGHVETNASVLEIHVWNDDDRYIHHDVILPAYPLCIEWLNFDSTKEEQVNYVATGDMTSEILLWDLDIVNQLEPQAKLVGHEDAVLCLSWNRLSRKVLASGSVDGSANLWDLNEMKSAHKSNHFGEKVQALQFHPVDVEKLLIGDCKGNLTLADCKSLSFKAWSTAKQTEIENVCWNTSSPSYFFAGTDKGLVYCFDIRVEDKPVYTISAHDEEVSGMALSSSCPGLLVTTSSDKKLKIWDVGTEKANFTEEFPRVKVGRILGLAANPDEPFVFAVGGDAKTNNFKVVDLLTLKSVESHFGPRVRK
ncbi:Periodic tryptophan protein 1 -like protein [Halotydeus destructor]|nr:Periodic tryptophan protein 1 -like protein [Halotydeus destructor]